MEAITIQKYIHTSPRKLRLVVDMVRNMPPTKALDILAITNKSAAKDLLKAINTVLFNAKQLGADVDKVDFKKIEINEGPRMKRYMAGTRGRVRPYARKMSHIKIVLTDNLNIKNQISNSKNKVGVDDSADKTKSTEGGMTESSKK